MQNENRKPTQADVAKRAGVSQAMVSYVLNGSTRLSIPQDTRQRIFDAIDQLGYVPDRSARSLRTRKTFTIAAIIPDITNPYHPIFARGAQDSAEKHGYDLIIYNTDGLYAREKSVLASVMQNHVDGVIGAFLYLKIEDMQRLFDRGIPVVLTEWYPHDPSPYPVAFTCIDNLRASRQAVEHLVNQGHRRIAHIRGIPDAPPAEARLLGYRQVLAEHGLPFDETLIPNGDFSIESGYTAMRALLALPERPTAVFASNDLAAIGAIDAIQEAGLRVPTDIAIVGFDDIPAASIVRPRLTTIRTFQKQVGARAAEVLIEQIQGRLPEAETRIDLPFELVVRQSG